MVKCSNCRCEIEDLKMMLHERFCKQNVKYCEECKTAIPLEEFDEHLSSHKSEIKTDLQKKLSKEKKTSSSLPKETSSKIECEYCGYPLCVDEIKDHEIMCSSRSTECKICHQKLIIKFLEAHLKVCHDMDKNTYNEFNNNGFFEDNQSYQNNESSKLEDSDLKRFSSYEQEYDINNSKKYGCSVLNSIKEENDDFEPDFGKMTEDEQLAYVIAQSQAEC